MLLASVMIMNDCGDSGEGKREGGLAEQFNERKGGSLLFGSHSTAPTCNACRDVPPHH